MLSVPLLVQANAFTYISSLFTGSVASAETKKNVQNSQTMQLLSPAINLDPNPAKGGGSITVVDGSALEPQEGPSGTVSDIDVLPRSSQISVHVVKEGETISNIAELYDVSVNTIRWANDIGRGDIVRPGQELVILPVTGIRHTVAKGEDLASIAKKYEGDAEEIANYNELSLDATLAAGDEVIIPDGVIASAPAKPASPASSPVRPAGTQAPVASVSGYTNPLPGSIKTQGVHGYNGVDLGGTPSGSPVLAADNGTVIIARGNGAWNGGYGNYVVVEHGGGVQTLYAHLSSVSVGVGQQVGAGEKLGGVGSTGRSTGIHLHFEVRGAKNPF